MVDEKNFVQNLSKSLSKNFEIYLDVKVDNLFCDLFGKFSDTKVRTFITTKDVIDKYTNHEYFVVKKITEPSLSLVSDYVNQVISFHESHTEPNEYHMSTITNCVLLVPAMDEAIAKFVKKFKYKRAYKFYLHGWSEIRLCVVEQRSGKILKSNNAGILKNFLEKLLSKKEEVLE